MASESNNQRGIWLALGRVSRLFRLNTGKGWISALGPKGVHRLKDGSVHIEAARPIALGFGLTSGEPVVGACDLPGWTEVVITPAMVGCKVAVFTSMEIKSGTGSATAEQKNWQAQVKSAGGIAGIVRSAEEALNIVKSYQPPIA